MLGTAQLTLYLKQDLEALLIPYRAALPSSVTHWNRICTATVELMQTQSLCRQMHLYNMDTLFQSSPEANDGKNSI